MNASDEEFIPDEADEGDAGLVKKLRERLKKATDEKQEYLDGWQRARADFVNYKKEEATLHTNKTERIKADIIEEFLPALDALELALRHSHSKELAMVEQQFLDSLKRIGAERFGKIGEVYDPHRHEALAMKSDDHVITSVERSGYKIGNKIIRAAQVII